MAAFGIQGQDVGNYKAPTVLTLLGGHLGAFSSRNSTLTEDSQCRTNGSTRDVLKKCLLLMPAGPST